jgi:hypothetical protein
MSDLSILSNKYNSLNNEESKQFSPLDLEMIDVQNEMVDIEIQKTSSNMDFNNDLNYQIINSDKKEDTISLTSENKVNNYCDYCCVSCVSCVSCCDNWCCFLCIYSFFDCNDSDCDYGPCDCDLN